MNFKRLALLALLFLPSALRAESQIIGGQWWGLNDGSPSIMIADNEAQSLQNVDFCEGAACIKKRDGYTQFKTIGTSTWGVRGGYYFRDVNGNDTIVHANNQSIFESVNGGAYSAFVTTDTAGSYYDFADSLGYLYRANSNRDEFVRYDGTTKTYYPSAPKGNQFEVTPDRGVIAGTTANPNRLHYSASGDLTNYTTGSEITDPFTEDIGLPGQSIQAIKYACGGILAWTRDSMSLVTAQNQYDQDTNPTIGISNTVGTIQPNTVVEDLGMVYWQGQDNHFYGYDCNVVRKISQKIAGSVENFVSSGRKDWIQTTQSDFSGGTISPSGSLSTSYSPGNISLSTPTIVSTGSWTLIGAATQCFRNYGSSGKIIEVINVSGLDENNLQIQKSVSLSTFTFVFDMDSTDGEGEGVYDQSIFEAILTTKTVGTAFDNAVDSGYGFYHSVSSPFEAGIYEYPGQVLLSSTTNGIASFAYHISRSSGSLLNFRANQSGGSFTNLTSVTDSTFKEFTTVIIRNRVDLSSSASSFNPTEYRFSARHAEDRGDFLSSFHEMASPSSFTQFNASYSLDDGEILFALYTDTNTSINTTNSATFVSGQTVTVGDTPTLSTSTYVLWQGILTRNDISKTPSIGKTIVSYYSGSNTRHFGSVDKDHRIIWSVAEGTATVPNVSYIYDPRFDSWLKYSFPFDAPAKVGDYIYFGGVSTGVVYNWPSGNTDDDADITAFWKSKDFVGTDLFTEKIFRNTSLIAATETGSSLTLDVFINGSGTATKTYTISLTNSSSLPYIRFNDNLSSGTFGSFINFKFGNTTGDAPFEVYALGYQYTPKAWRVLP